MKVARFVIKGRVPSKKNSRNVFVRRGKQFNIPSSDYNKWHNQAAIQLSLQEKIKLKGVCEVQMIWFMPDNRKCDLTNKTESIMDLLVDCEIIVDDNWQIIPRIMIECRGVFKDNPLVEIWIKEIMKERNDRSD